MLKFCAIILWIPTLVLAQDPGSFLGGVKAYQEKNFDQAKEIFNQILSENPENPTALFNLGLSEYQLGHFGMAMGLWRKARSLNPSDPAIQQAISFVEEKLFPNQSEPGFYEVIVSALTQVPLGVWGFIGLFAFFLSGWWAVEYGVKRLLPLGQWPSLFFGTLPLAIVALTFYVSLSFDQNKLRATVVEKDRQIHTNPSETSPTTSELKEGQVVFVEKALGDWIQIRTKTGTPGWVPQSSLISFKGI